VLAIKDEYQAAEGVA